MYGLRGPPQWTLMVLAQHCGRRTRLEIDPLADRQGVVEVDPEMAHRSVHPHVTEQVWIGAVDWL
jgi:hypothetical protein